VTFLAPLWLWVAAAAIAAVVALHFFARQRPRPAPLPTARFVPDLSVRAPSLARTPSDPLLLALRVLALAAAGLALARPHPAPARRPVARVVAVAASPAMRSAPASLDTARALLGDGDTLVLAPTISATLIAAIRASSAVRDRADSVELVLVSALARGDVDAATDSIRRLWPGRMRLVRVATAELEVPRTIVLAGDGDDPLRAPLALLGRRRGAVTRIARGELTAADSQFAREGGVLVEWPRDPAKRWPAASTDTIGAVTAGGVIVVAPFVRHGTPASPIPNPQPPTPPSWWSDGSTAADEQPLGNGCLRRVWIGFPERGDLVLRRSVRDLVDALSAPCGGAIVSQPLDDEFLERLLGPAGLMPARLAPAAERPVTRASAWLFGLAALLLGAESLARSRRSRP